MKIYIVVFPDRTIVPLRIKPKILDFGKDTKAFETDGEIKLFEIQNWIRVDFPTTSKIKKIWGK